MRIADLDLHLLDPAGALAESPLRTLLLRLTTADGQQGWGEARVGWRGAELVPRRERLLPILAGSNVANVERLLENDGLLPTGLRAATEMACWDLIARNARQPLYRIWGGEYRPRVPLAVQLPCGDPQRTAEQARGLVERGFATQVLLSSGDVPQDAAVVAAVQDATARRIQLRLDAAGKYREPQARELCRRLEQHALQFIIDPLATGLDGLAVFARQSAVPIAVSKAILAPADVLALARTGVPAHLVIDLALVGGLWPARLCTVVAAAAQLPASLRGGIGLGVSLAGVLQLAAATPHLAPAQEIAVHQLYEDIFRDRLVISDGMVTVPQGRGLGVDVDRARIESYQVA